MSVFTFILGGILSLFLTIGLFYLIYKKSALFDINKFWRITAIVGMLYILLNISYARNWIPPVPLSLKEGAIYHHVSRQGERYSLKFQKPEWYQFWKDSDDTFCYSEGDTVFCFTAIFAPTLLQKNVYHVWRKYFPERNEWIPTDRLGFEITGGRKMGYRGYTYKQNVSPGKWRVDVRTGDDLLLGRISFVIKRAKSGIKEFEITYQ